MLREDDGEEGAPKGIGLALKRAKSVLPAVGIVRREHDEAALGEARGVGFVGTVGLGLGIVVDGVGGHAFESVLADDDGTAFAGLEIFRQQQHAPREDVGPHVEHHVVAGPFLLVVDLARAGVHRERCGGEAPHHVVPEVGFARAHFHAPRVGGFCLNGFPEGLVALPLAVAEDALGVVDELGDGALLAGVGIGRGTEEKRRGGEDRELVGDAEFFQEDGESAFAHRPDGGAFIAVNDAEEILEGAGKFLRAHGFVIEGVELRRLPASGRGSAAAIARRGRAGDLRRVAVLDDERAGRDERGDFRVTEFAEQPEDIAVDRFLPETIAVVEVTADQRGVDAGIQRGGVQRDQSALGVSGHADARRGVGREPVHGGQHLLHFVADDMASDLEGLAVDPFTMRLVGEALELRIAGPGVGAIDERGHEHEAAGIGEASGELRRGGEVRGEAGDLFRRLVGVGQRDDGGDRRSLWFEQKPFAEDALEHRPAHLMRGEMLALAEFRRPSRGGNELQFRHRQARIDGPDNRAEVLSIRGDRFLVSVS